MNLTATVNGVSRTVEDVRPHESLLHVLRERLGLTGAKNACEQGECGSCTVRLDGDAVCACLVPAGQADGAVVVTVEGLAQGGRLCAAQDCFLKAGGVQCGFCTPGLLMSLDHLLERNPDPSEADIREGLAGNLCRCTGYQKIVEAAGMAAERLRGQ
ncbi:(2Fe-2S)-binding protein [Phytomonospora sp. NPDC050363]|uniref:(2Fe-2S)-binding protein n=1 Tax=Phytomonospora sp. NPDC050363 TaxID=3155642 RepID=UPI0033C34CBD